ncbi:AhpC/TSA antioxidant enzyme-domain-containing protein [Kalaharituber pfeilii]|nr:AhpC/TSA antioxidant enzyme-domain-containing protein [Kalaharituber pfeilii]
MAGPSQVTSTAPPSEDHPSPEALKTAGDIPIFDAQGNQAPFKSLYESPGEGDVLTMIIFIRHFYCSACQAYVTALSQTIPANDKKKIIIIGCGSHTLIPNYATETHCPYPIFAEPTQKLHATLGLARTLAPGKKPEYLKDAGMLGLIKKSVVQGLTWGGAFKGGDIQQVGGEFLFVGGECVWCHRMKTTADHVEVSELKKVMGIEE